MTLLLLVLGCIKPLRGGNVAEEGPILLGWRLVPGETLSYAHTTRWEAEPGDALTRVEHWSYLVRDVDPQGIATLEGRLTGLGLERTEGGTREAEATLTPGTEQEKERLGAATVTLTMAQDGRLVDLTGVGWADGLTHRLLALQLSPEPVERGARWPDPVLARPYADLVPVDVEVRVEGYETYDGFNAVGQAKVISTGRVAPVDGGPEIWLAGDARWDPQTGRLEQRELSAHMEMLKVQDPGVLTLRIERMD